MLAIQIAGPLKCPPGSRRWAACGGGGRAAYSQSGVKYTLMDVKQLTGANELYREGPHARGHGGAARRCQSERGG